MNKIIFLSDISNVEFGYRQAFSGAIKSLSTRKSTGQTLGQIGSKFGRKMLNASKGKIASIGRLGNKVGRVFSGNRGSIKLTSNQQKRATTNITNSGGRMLTKTGKFTPSSNLNTGIKQVRTKNNYVQNSPL